MSEQTSETVTLRRTFGLREAITITAGTVIGVGLFTTGGNIVGQMGAAVILATFIAMVISVYPALLYGEMGASLPYAGGTYRYASLGIGRPFGFLAGWNFVISLVSVTAGESLAFSYYFKTMFAAFGVELPIDDALLACIVLIFFYHYQCARRSSYRSFAKRFYVLLLGCCGYLVPNHDSQCFST